MSFFMSMSKGRYFLSWDLREQRWESTKYLKCSRRNVTAATDKASGRDSSRESPDFSCRGEWGEFEKWGAPFLSGRSCLLLFEEMCVTLVAENACRAVGL